MKNQYRNTIFTKHAVERMKKRSITKRKIWQTIKKPDKKSGNKYIKTIDDRQYYAVADYLKNEQKYLVISAWVRGEDDKPEFIWQLVSLPFRIIWWILKKLW